ncbi:MAG: hypothetical protein JWO36_2261 [Myxococcales bacterium]|nr:hypothetical protein [Myxococcales bacterium]
MRRVPIIAILIWATVAGAKPTATAPKPVPATTWADWVGDWAGKLTWRSCTADGAPAVSLPIEATNGAVTIDLTAAGSALGMMSLVDETGSFMGQQADITVHLTRHADTVELAVDLTSGCQVRGSLQRTSVTGIAQCDRLVAWAQIEARCTKLDRPPLELATRLARQRETWSKAHAEERTKIVAQCDARSTKVEAELVDAGCAPNPDPEIGLRGAQCQVLRQIAARFERCASSPPDLKTRFGQSAAQLAAAAQTADTSAMPVVDAECRELRARIASAAQHYACP